MSRKHKQPIRTCIGCRRERRKREMIRIVHTTQGAIEIDPKGKMAGRGAYLCANARCWNAALTKGQVERALRTTLSEEDRSRLQAQALTFPRFDARAGE